MLAAAIVIVAVAGRSELFPKAKTTPQATNASLRLGPGRVPARPNAVVRAGATATAVAVGDYSTCAIVVSRIDCWGDDAFGQLGDATKENSLTPVAVPGLQGARAVGLGGSHGCAVLGGGEVSCWGATAGGTGHLPALVPGLAHAVSVAVGVA